MEHKNAIAVGKVSIAMRIALQTHVLKACPLHNALFCDDDVDPSGAFALAVELINQQTPYVDEFEGDAHALTDLLSATIGEAPSGCPACASRDQNSRQNQNPNAERLTRAGPSRACECGGLGERLLQAWQIIGLGQQEYAWPTRAENESHVQPVT
jgi:hypothetical protein